MRSLVFLLALVALAGCAAAPASTVTSSTAPPPAASPTADAATGSIAGLVVNTEQAPIERATVSLVETAALATTDAEGRFTFNDLAPGSYRLVLERAGFGPTGKKVDVTAGEITEVRIAMEPIAIADEPYHEAIHKRAYIKNRWVFLTTFGSAANGTGALSNLCDPCIFHLYYGKNLVQARAEAHWVKSNLDPAVNNRVFLQYYVGYTSTSDGSAATTGYVANRGALPITSDGVAAMKKVDSVRLRVNGDLQSINFDHKPEVWTTCAYGAELPEGYTALPPP